jgi:hypothetical protein
MKIFKTYFKHFQITLFFIVFFFNVHSQSGFVSTGANKLVSEKGEITYSVGEVGYVNIKSNRGSMEIGIQQAFQFIPITPIIDINLFNGVYVYPNPTQGLLFIKNLTQQMIRGKLEIKIYSNNGSELISKSIKSVSTVIDINQFDKGLYHISLYESDRLISNYKIIKL